MGERERLVTGKIIYRWWFMQKRLYQTRRDGLTRFLSRFLSAVGVYVVAQGILICFFFDSLLPSRVNTVHLQWDCWEHLPLWISGVCLIVIGIAGLFAGLALGSKRPPAVYISLILLFVIFFLGIILLCWGVSRGAPILVAGGIIDILLAVSIYVLLVLCWYTIDPLGLYWGETTGRSASR